MQSNRHIFTLNEKPSSTVQAKYILQHFYPRQGASVEYIKSTSLKKLKKKELSTLVYVGEFIPTSSRDKAAEKFSDMFIKQCGKTKKKRKLCVKDIYIIGWNNGKINNEQHDIPQDIADILFKNGFKNVIIHCVGNPPNATEKHDIRTTVEGRKGTANGITLTSSVSDTTSNNVNDRLEFISSTDPITELNKQQYRYIPNETPTARAERINIATLALGYNEPYFSVLGTVNVPTTANQPTAPITQTPDTDKGKEEREGHNLHDDTSVEATPSKPSMAEVENDTVNQTEELTLVEAHIYNNLKNNIAAQALILEDEKGKLQSGCTAGFFRNKVNAKKVKLDALNDLNNQPSFTLFKQKAAELKSNPTVISGIFSKRTLALLNAAACDEAVTRSLK